MSNSKKSKNCYAKIINNYKEEDYFVQSTILLKYMLYHQEAVAGKKSYVITGVELHESNDSRNKEKIGKIVEKCNNDILDTSKEYSWQIFYALKVLLRDLTSDRIGFNYFRGQSHDHPLLPGALRYNDGSAYIKDFESIYKKLAYAFPDTINYVSMSKITNLAERETNLSVLQHYGLKTALLDITKNPYIAMLFMLNDSISEYKEPTLYLFNINEQLEKDETLFTEVRKNQTNERILAQKGAFLNYEKTLLKNKNYKKIPYIKIVLRFDDTVYKEVLNKEIDAYTELKKYIKDQGHRDLEKFLENDLTELNKQLDSIEKYKVNALKDILEDLENKLNEYCYTKEEMFPDFENRIRYLSNKYNKSDEEDLRYTQPVIKNNNKNHN